MTRLAIINATAVIPQPIQELIGDVLMHKGCWVGASSGPIRVCQPPASQLPPIRDKQHGLNVVLVNVAMRSTKVPELRIVFHIRHHLNDQLPLELKPLPSFAELLKGNLRQHAPVVPATAIGRRVVECGDETLFRVHYVVVEECEVEERNTAL